MHVPRLLFWSSAPLRSNSRIAYEGLEAQGSLIFDSSFTYMTQNVIVLGLSISITAEPIRDLSPIIILGCTSAERRPSAMQQEVKAQLQGTSGIAALFIIQLMTCRNQKLGAANNETWVVGLTSRIGADAPSHCRQVQRYWNTGSWIYHC